MRPLGTIMQFGSSRRSGGRRGATRSRKRSTSRTRKPQSFGKWWTGKKRSIKYLRQGLAPYAVVLSFAFLLLVVAALWASGVFGQLKEEIDHFARRSLAAGGLAIEQVTVEGRNNTDKIDLNKALGALRGESILHFDLEAAQKRIEDLSWVDQARLVRLLPETIHVNLVEHRPVAIWQLDGKLSLINRDGSVIANDQLSSFGHLPHVVGKGADRKAAELIELLNRYPLIRSRVSAAIRVGDRRWNLRLDSGVDVQLPDQQEEQALQRLIALEEKHRLLARDITQIDLRDPERLFVRMTSDRILQFKGKGLET